MNTHNGTSLARKSQTGAIDKRLNIALAIVAILLIALLVYFIFLRPATTPDGMPAEPPPPTSKEARPDSAREVISKLKEQAPVDYASAFRQAGEFRENGELADAQLLYFFAARGGNGPAAFELAGMYDPVLFDPATSLMDQADAFQAYKWYRIAQKAGESAAAERLSALKTWAQSAAETGDLQAEQLILQWEQ